MNSNRVHAHWLILFTLLGSACSSMPQGANSAANGSFDKQGPILGSAIPDRSSELSLAPVGKVAIGQVATLSAQNPLGVTRARVVDEYSAASGRLCRRVTIAEKQPRLRLVCRGPGGDWSLVRGLVAAQR